MFLKVRGSNFEIYSFVYISRQLKKLVAFAVACAAKQLSQITGKLQKNIFQG